MDAEKTVEGLIQKAYASLKIPDAEGAQLALKEALKLDFEHPEVLYALHCLSWWLGRFKDSGLSGTKDSGLSGSPDSGLNGSPAYEYGGYILSQWKSYYSFLERIGGQAAYDSCRYAVKHFVFSTALGFFEDLLGSGENQHDPLLLLQVGRCYKGVGNFEEALKYLEQAARFKREDGETLSELADVNALLEETRAAKALFREAFFIDPQGIEIRNMDSELILRLAERVRDLGYSGQELLEWIPIYGTLYGVFSVKRELKLAELGKLKQSIFVLENEVRGKSGQELLIPKLINRYLWLIDHYENIKAEPALIEETMLKIKILDPAVYERYRN
ncbi:MAG: hypothetical protein LBC31_05360 [Treponema sp.]|jgi:tetratricopeptide (TPR) repeat protein|nr:hypothetical protein [Treponema sp.]